MDGKINLRCSLWAAAIVAMDVAVTAKRLGAKKVTLACLEPRDQMPASAEEIARAEEEGVVIMPGWGLSRVVEENGVVKGMELKRCISPWDDTGAFNPQYDENEKSSSMLKTSSWPWASGWTSPSSMRNTRFSSTAAALSMLRSPA